MKKNLFICFGFFVIQYIYASNPITLVNCYETAYNSSPVAKNKAYYNEIYQLKRKIITTNWLPSLELNGQATYQSDISQMDLSPLINYISSLSPKGTTPSAAPSIDIPSAPKDQYKATLDIKQTIYDGGISRTSKVLEEQTLLANIQQVETDLYGLKDQINQVFFSILILDKNIELLYIIQQNVDSNIAVMTAGVNNGVFLQSDLDVLIAEKIKFKQQLFELKTTRDCAIQVMNLIINDTISENADFILPDISFLPDTIQNGRPELMLFNANNKILETTKSIKKSQLQPKLFVFSQLGYGNPGLNMLNDEFDSFYIIGAGLKWNIYDWNKTRNENQVITIQQKMIDVNMENFTKNISIAAKNKYAEIVKLNEMLESDLELINIRRKITKTASSQLNNGVINSTQYLTELNAERQARINYEMHKIELAQAKVNYLNLFGKL